MTKWYLSSLWCSQYLLSMMSTDSWTPWPWQHTQWSCNLIFLFIDKVLTKLPYPHSNPSYLTMWEEHSNPYLRSPFSWLFYVKGDLLRLSEIQDRTFSSHIFCYRIKEWSKRYMNATNAVHWMFDAVFYIKRVLIYYSNIICIFSFTALALRENWENQLQKIPCHIIVGGFCKLLLLRN